MSPFLRLLGLCAFPALCFSFSAASLSGKTPRCSFQWHVPHLASASGVPTRLQFPNTGVREVLSFYEHLTKKRLIIDNQVQGTVKIVAGGAVFAEVAIRIIEINLLLNGDTLVPAEGSNMVKVLGNRKNPRTVAIPFVSDELRLPEEQQVVAHIAKLHDADPAEVAQTVSTFVVPAPGAVSKRNRVAEITDTRDHREHRDHSGLIPLLREIDIPPAEVVSEFIPLERADAKDV